MKEIFYFFSRAREMVMNIVSTLSRNESFGTNGGDGGCGNSSGSGNDSDGHFNQNQNSGPPGQAFVCILLDGIFIGINVEQSDK